MRFIDAYRQEFGGVAPICRVLREHGCQIAPSTDWAATARPTSARQVRDEQLLVVGLTNREVADRLFVSPHTVNSHLRHVFTKLGIDSRIELARLAHEYDMA